VLIWRHVLHHNSKITSSEPDGSCVAMRTFCAFLLALFACREPGSPMQPFQIPQWSSRPSADELLNAIVGTGGSSSDRAAAEGAVRDLLLPSLGQEKGLEELRFSLEGLRREFEHAPEQGPVTRLIRIAVRDELGRLEERSMKLAEKRLHVTLWPTEPVPETWEGISDLEPLPTIDAIATAAIATERRLDEIRARYGIGHIGEQRSELLVRNYVRVAKAGDYSRTTGSVYRALAARGISTMPLPGANPW
jgi:hypothetical protein